MGDLHLTVHLDLVAVQEVSVEEGLVADHHHHTAPQGSVVTAEEVVVAVTTVGRYDMKQELSLLYCRAYLSTAVTTTNYLSLLNIEENATGMSRQSNKSGAFAQTQ